MDVNPAEASLLISQSHVRFFSWGNPSEWVQMRTLTVEAVFKKLLSLFSKAQSRLFVVVTCSTR